MIQVFSAVISLGDILLIGIDNELNWRGWRGSKLTGNERCRMQVSIPSLSVFSSSASSTLGVTVAT